MSILFRKHFHPTISLANIKEKPVENGLLYLTEFFRHFGIHEEEKIQQALQLFEPRIYRKSSWFLREGDTADRIGFIVNGAVEAFYKQHNRHQILLLLMEEDFFTDLRSFLHREPTRLNMRFREDTIVLEISHENFAGFILQNKPFADMFMKVMVDIMSTINEHNQLLKLPTRSRFEYLLKMKPEVFNRFLLQDIASFIGVKQETLSRARRYFSRKKSNDVETSN
ncbi:Crp/Fnr family transcriptional regulator [Nostoc ellipsosporum NOK]|nr:Crp/Fnr family transcriptional regulator [Nostoc ellipsosporum NOK]